MKRILVLGAGGQIGTELVPHLQSLYGSENVIAADLKPEVVEKLGRMSRAVMLNALDIESYAKLLKSERIDSIYNLVARSYMGVIPFA